MQIILTDLSRYNKILSSIEITQRLFRFIVLVTILLFLGIISLTGFEFFFPKAEDTIIGAMLSRAVIPSEETWGLAGTPSMQTVSRFLF